MSNVKLIAEGYYDVKVKSYGSGLSKETRSPYAWVKFDNGLFWRGYLSEKTIERTTLSLAVCGFNGASLADLNKEGILNLKNNVNVSVTHEVKQTKGGGTNKVATVKWINPPYTKKELDPQDTLVLEGIDLRAHMAVARKELGDGVINNSIQETQGSEFTSENIPF